MIVRSTREKRLGQIIWPRPVEASINDEASQESAKQSNIKRQFLEKVATLSKRIKGDEMPSSEIKPNSSETSVSPHGEAEEDVSSEEKKS